MALFCIRWGEERGIAMFCYFDINGWILKKVYRSRKSRNVGKTQYILNYILKNKIPTPCISQILPYAHTTQNPPTPRKLSETILFSFFLLYVDVAKKRRHEQDFVYLRLFALLSSSSCVLLQ